MEFKNGTSRFNYGILNDIVTLQVYISWDDDEYPIFEEILVDGYDITEDALGLGLSEKLINYALENEIFEKDAE